jgi:hypothetical protein
MRKAKASSVSGQVLAMQNVLAPLLEPPWKLDRERLAVWREVIERRSRDEWAAIDLRFCVELVDVIHTRHEESQRLEAEGSVIDGKINPRFLAVTQLSNRALRLATYLRVHPSSETNRNPSLVRAGRSAERAARDTIGRIDAGTFLAGRLPPDDHRN